MTRRRMLPLFIGGLTGPVYATFFFDIGARPGVVVILTVLVVGILFGLDSRGEPYR